MNALVFCAWLGSFSGSAVPSALTRTLLSATMSPRGEVKRITHSTSQGAPAKLPTVKDIARLAGLSQAAVSYALSGRSSRVSDATRQRVLKVAEELGYQPNVLARVMKGKETGLLGIIVRDGSAPTGYEMCRALMRKAPSYGYSLILLIARLPYCAWRT
jgi:transcriptional regulator with XRE-family HTH domain